MERGHPQKRVAGLRLFSGPSNLVSDLCPGRSCALRALLGPDQHGRRRFARRVPFGRWKDLAMPGLRQQLPTTVSLEDSGRTVTVPPLPQPTNSPCGKSRRGCFGEPGTAGGGYAHVFRLVLPFFVLDREDNRHDRTGDEDQCAYRNQDIAPDRHMERHARNAQDDGPALRGLHVDIAAAVRHVELGQPSVLPKKVRRNLIAVVGRICPKPDGNGSGRGCRVSACCNQFHAEDLKPVRNRCHFLGGGPVDGAVRFDSGRHQHGALRQRPIRVMQLGKAVAAHAGQDFDILFRVGRVAQQGGIGCGFRAESAA